MPKIGEILSERSKDALRGLDLPPMTSEQLARLRVASRRRVNKYHENVVSISTLKLRANFRRSLERDAELIN